MRPSALRHRLMLAFAAGSLVLSALLAAGAWFLTSQIMMNQRLHLAEQQGLVMATRARGLVAAGRSPAEAVATLEEPLGTRACLWQRGGGSCQELLPRTTAQPPCCSQQRTEWLALDKERAIAVWTPLGPDHQLLEVTRTTELNASLRTLMLVLAACSAATTLAGGLFGRQAARTTLRPLDEMGQVAADIAAGRSERRLRGGEDPDVGRFVEAFNRMVDGLQARIDRDARFSSDVAHELRSPLTTLVGSVALLSRRKHLFAERDARTVELLERELDRFREMLEDLLELGRVDATEPATELVDLRACLAAELPQGGGAGGGLAQPPQGTPLLVRGDSRLLRRAVRNLVRNASLHGGGLVGVELEAADGWVELHVDDAGPGVAPQERAVIFERFRRGGARASLPGSGLGLSLVAEAATNSGGQAWCAESPQGGARFVLRLPLAEASATGQASGGA